MAMTQKQRKSDCKPYHTFPEPTFAGPTTPSSTAMGQMNVKLPDNSDVVVTLWTDTAKLQIATLDSPDNSYTCYIPIQISAPKNANMAMMTSAIDGLQQLLLPVNSGSACASLGDQDVATGKAVGNSYTTLQMCCNQLLRQQMVD
ncbi:unnamed protein product [Sphagnum balticum]